MRKSPSGSAYPSRPWLDAPESSHQPRRLRFIRDEVNRLDETAFEQIGGPNVAGAFRLQSPSDDRTGPEYENFRDNDVMCIQLHRCFAIMHIGAMRRSRVLEKIRNDEVARIACLYYANSMFPRHAANAGYDGVWIDGEHNSFDPRELERLLYLQRLADIDSIVRCPSRERTFLYRLLEVGATDVMIPLVSTRGEAEALVDAVKFPPLGNRGLDGASIDNDFYLHGTSGYAGAVYCFFQSVPEVWREGLGGG